MAIPEQNIENNDKSNFLFLYDIWALLAYIIFYLYIYKYSFENFNLKRYNYELCLEHLYKFLVITSITLTVFVFNISLFIKHKYFSIICYNLPLSTATFTIFINNYKNGLKYSINDKVKEYMCPILCAVFVAIYLLVFLFYIKNKLYYTNKLLRETLVYYKNDIIDFVFFFLSYFLLIYITATITFELERNASQKISDLIPRYIFFAWTYFSFIMSSKILACSLIHSKLKSQDKFTISIDDIFISAGRIIFSSFLHPISFLAIFFQIRTTNANSNNLLNTVKKINNMVVKILDALTFNLLTKKHFFALQCSFYYKTTTLNGIKKSHSIANDKNIAKNYKSNVFWHVHFIFFVFLSFYISDQVTKNSNSYFSKRLFYFLTFIYFTILTEFVFYSCNALLFYYSIDQMVLLDTNTNLQNIFVYNNQNTKYISK